MKYNLTLNKRTFEITESGLLIAIMSYPRLSAFRSYLIVKNTHSTG